MLEKKHYFWGAFWIALSVFALFVFAKSTLAQNNDSGINLTVNPPVIELIVKSGDVINDKFRIRNNGNSPVNLNLGLKKLSPNNGQIIPSDFSANDPVANWVKIDPQTLTALPGEWLDVHYTITVPLDAGFGYYLGFRIYQNLPNDSTTSGAKLQGEVLIPTLITVKKDGLKAEGKLISFRTNSFLNQYLPVTFQATIENLGNIHIKPRGNIFIRDSKNTDISILEINPQLDSILPGTQRTFDASWDDGFLVKVPQYNGSSKLKINWNKLTEFRFGKYTADLLMVYDNGQRDIPLNATVNFWVIPYGPILIIIGLAILTILAIRFYLKSYIEREVRKRR